MASSLLAMLSQQSPSLQTRKGLLLTGLQNEFLSTDGKMPVITTSGFIDRLRELVPAFREQGDIIWVRSHFQDTQEQDQLETATDRMIASANAGDSPGAIQNDDVESDGSPVPMKKARLSNESGERPVTVEDLIDRIETGHAGLTELHEDGDPSETETPNTDASNACCLPGSFGAEYATQIRDLVDAQKDIEVIKTSYSAFRSTSLLLTLRSKLITELFIGGCVTNLSVFATAMDAARYGIKVTLVEDCLGYRRKARHELGLKQLRDYMEAKVMASADVIKRLRNQEISSERESEEPELGVDGSVEGVVDAGAADRASADELEVDDSDNEDDFLPNVRPYISTRSYALRYRSATMQNSLSNSETELEPTPPPKPPESADIRGADPSYVADDGCGPRSVDSNAHGSDGKGGINVRRWLASTADSKGVGNVNANDESSRRANSQGPRVFDGSWAAHTRASRIVAGKSSHPGLNAISALVGLDQSVVNDFERQMAEARRDQSSEERSSFNCMPLFGKDKAEGSGTSRIVYDLLGPGEAEAIFTDLYSEITWQKMMHQTGQVPRLASCQGTIGSDGSMPVYRHPSDRTLLIESWTPAVNKVRRAAERAVGHELNHALIQLYRGGTDYISEHSDKTLDIAKGSFIVNVSFGAQRAMRFRTKRAAATAASPGRTTHRVQMPHNSMIMMSLATNAEYLHGINADKRPPVELSEAEKAYEGQRISLTFRKIATFLNEDSTRIWGQGAIAKTKEHARPVISADAVESERLVRAFGTENQSSSIDWEHIYEDGFDVLHLK